eukprot:COSAG02_NODE_1367_length_13033_cov_31.905900_5_plen_1427_part_01
MFLSKPFSNTRLGGDTGPAVAGCGDVGQRPLVANKTIQIFVCSAANQTHALQLKPSALMGDLSAAAQRFGYGPGADRLCFLGGAPLPRDDRLTLAEVGLRANSSLQVVGVLRGGVEVTLFEQQHSIGDTGLLDLKGKDVGPAKLKEVASFFSSPESYAVRNLVLSGSMITNCGKDLSGLKALCEVFPTLKHPISLDLANCGLGVAEVNEVATAISAGVALNSVTVDSTSSRKLSRRFGVSQQQVDASDSRTYTLTVGEEKIDLSQKNLGSADVALVAAWLKRPEVSAALNSITLDGQAISGSTPQYGDFAEGIDKVDANLTGFKLLCDALGSSQIEVISMKSCYLGREALALLADAIKLMAALNSVTIDSTGDTTDEFGDWQNGGPQTYTLTMGEEHLDLSSKNLGPVDVTLVAAWLTTSAGAAVSSLAISGNFLFGSKDKDRYDSTQVHDVDKDQSGWNNLCEQLKVSNITSFTASDIGMGPVALRTLATSLPAALTSINCLKNPIADDGLASLVAAVTDSSVRSICGLVEGQTVAHFSKQNLKPFDCKIIAAEFGFRGFIAALNSVTVDSTGDTKDRGGRWNNGGPKTYTLIVGDEKIDLSNKNLGSADVALLATWLQRPEVSAALNSVTIDSTGVPKLSASYMDGYDESGPRTYTLTATEENIDLSKKNLGSTDVTLVATWLQRPEVSAAVEAIAIGANPITSEGGATLLETIKTSKLKTIDIGKPLPLQEPYASDTLDLSNTQMDPGHVLLLSWWLGTEFSAAVARLILNQNPLTGGDYGDFDKDVTGVSNLFDTLKTSSVTELCLAECRLGPGSLGKLAEYVRDAEAAVARLILDENPLTGGTRSTDFDKDITGIVNLCDTLKTSSVTELGLAKCRLGPGSLGKLAEYVREAEAAVARLILDENPLTGILDTTCAAQQILLSFFKEKHPEYANMSKIDRIIQSFKAEAVKANQKPEGKGWHELMYDAYAKEDVQLPQLLDIQSIVGHGKDITGVVALCDTLKTSFVTELSLAKCQLGPGSLGKLVEYVREAEAALTSLNCLHNPLGEGLQVIIKAFEETPRLRTLCGLEEGVEHIDWSKSGKRPIEVALLAANLKASRAAAALNSVTIDSTGVPAEYDYYNDLVDGTGPKTYTLTASEEKIDVSSKNLGPADVALLSIWLQRLEVSAALNSVTLDSTGVMTDKYGHSGKGTQKAYTLTVGEEKIDLSKKNLGSADVALVATWLQRPEVSAVLTSINCLMNPIGEDGLATLVSAVKDSSVRSICGLIEGQTTADFSGMGLGPFDCKIMNAEFDFGGAMAVMNSLTLDMNGIFGELYPSGDVKEADKFAGDCDAFFAALKGSNIVTLSLQKTGIGPPTLRKLATSLPAAVSSLAISGNFLFGSKDKNWYCQHDSTQVHDVDKDQSGWNNLCEQLKVSNITSFTA